MIQHAMINLQMRHARRGMTLVDLLLAIGILAVGLSMIATVFPVAAEHTREAVDQSMAVVVARNAEATLRAMATSADYPAHRFTSVAQLNQVIEPYRTAGAPNDASVLAENTYFVALPELIRRQPPERDDLGIRIKDAGLNVFSFRPYVNGSSGAMDTEGQYYWRAVYSRRVTPVSDTITMDNNFDSRVDLIIMVCKLPDGQTFDKNSRISLSHIHDPVPTWDYEGQGVGVKDGSYMRFAGSAPGRALFGGLKTGGVDNSSFWYLWYDPNAIYFYRTAIRVVQ